MTDHTKAIEAVIKQAIKGEEDAYALYTSAARIVTATQAQTMLSDMAKEELGHKSRLEGLLRQGIAWNIAQGEFKRVTDLKVGDHLAAKPLEAGADLQAVLMYGIQREKESHELYTTMGGLTGDATVRNLFEFLANEELTHKRKLETLYEEVIYKHF